MPKHLNFIIYRRLCEQRNNVWGILYNVDWRVYDKFELEKVAGNVASPAPENNRVASKKVWRREKKINFVPFLLSTANHQVISCDFLKHRQLFLLIPFRQLHRGCLLVYVLCSRRAANADIIKLKSQLSRGSLDGEAKSLSFYDIFI